MVEITSGKKRRYYNGTTKAFDNGSRSETECNIFFKAEVFFRSCVPFDLWNNDNETIRQSLRRWNFFSSFFMQWKWFCSYFLFTRIHAALKYQLMMHFEAHFIFYFSFIVENKCHFKRNETSQQHELVQCTLTEQQIIYYVRTSCNNFSLFL